LPLVCRVIQYARVEIARFLQLAAPPEAPEALEFFAVDVWMSAAGMSEYYEDPEFLRGFQDLFAAPPSTSVWTHPAGDWVEW